LLIEVCGDHKKVETVRAEIARLAGSEVAVRSLQRRRLVEIRDLDEWMVKEEVSETVRTTLQRAKETTDHENSGFEGKPSAGHVFAYRPRPLGPTL